MTRIRVPVLLAASLALTVPPATAGTPGPGGPQKPPTAGPKTAGPKTPGPKGSAARPPKAPVSSKATPQGPKAVPPGQAAKATPKGSPGKTPPGQSGKSVPPGQAAKSGVSPFEAPPAVPKNPKLAARLESSLPAGMTIEQAALGFRNQGQFVAAVRVSENLGIPFVELKARMVDDGLSLGQAIQGLKPGANGDAEASRAVSWANRELKDR